MAWSRDGDQKVLGEECAVVLLQPTDRLFQGGRTRDHGVDLFLQQLSVQQLFGVLPFIERLVFAESFVTL
jgi:hypothetical protein